MLIANRTADAAAQDLGDRLYVGTAGRHDAFLYQERTKCLRKRERVEWTWRLDRGAGRERCDGFDVRHACRGQLYRPRLKG